jgi:hypothetical protein
MPRFLPLVLGGLTVLLCQRPALLAAQPQAPAEVADGCQGRRIVDVTYRSSRRELIPRRFDPVARIAQGVVDVLQPPTRTRLVRRFLLLAEGERCDEQARVESERILRAQPYISDATIRAVPVGPDAVRLEVETIDEYVLYFESWGWRGVPAGLEIGTGSVAGSGKSARTLVEVGRGGEVGWGLSYTDFQFAGRPLTFAARVRSRPLADLAAVSLARPWYSNYQRDSWRIELTDGKTLFTFRDPVIRDISVDYRRRLATADWTRRLGGVNAPFIVGLGADAEVADLERVVQIRERGPIAVSPTPELARFRRYEATRVGGTVGIRQLRFLPVRGLGALSATEDVAVGVEGWVSARLGIPALQRDPVDRTLGLSTAGAVGRASSLLRWRAGADWTTARPGTLPAQSNLSVRAAWSTSLAPGHLSLLTFRGQQARNTRLPTQLDFRDDRDGLLGFRSSNLGGSQRVIASFEERHRLPVPRVELAMAGLAQVGRLWAGDAPYGSDTPWHYSVGGALLMSYPAGAKQTLRMEVGAPLNAPPGLQRLEFRLVFADFTGRF